MTDKEVMQMALDALNTLTKELIACRDELAERGARPETPHKQKLWDSAFNAYTGMAIPTYEAIRARLAQPEKEQEPMALPDWPERESLADLEYAQTTPEDWTEDYKQCWQQLQVCERNKIILWKHAKALEDAVEYERAEKVKFFKLYNDACETAQLRLQEIAKLDVSLKNSELLQTGAKTAAWRDHVEQRIRTWRQRTMNRSGDMLAIDDFMGQDSIDDLVDFVCDEWAMPPQYAVPEGYALIGIDALKAWSVYEQVSEACRYPVPQLEKEQKAVANHNETSGSLVKIHFPRRTPRHGEDWIIEPAFLQRVRDSIYSDTDYCFIPSMEQIETALLALEVIPSNLYTASPQRERVQFPAMLRKMWSGSEVQAWLDENVNKEKNT